MDQRALWKWRFDKRPQAPFHQTNYHKHIDVQHTRQQNSNTLLNVLLWNQYLLQQQKFQHQRGRMSRTACLGKVTSVKEIVARSEFAPHIRSFSSPIHQEISLVYRKKTALFSTLLKRSTEYGLMAKCLKSKRNCQSIRINFMNPIQYKRPFSVRCNETASEDYSLKAEGPQGSGSHPLCSLHS